MFNELETAFGRPFLEYVLATSRLEEGLSAKQQEVTAALHQYVVAANQHPHPFQKMHVLELTAQYANNLGMSQVSAMRLHCGGELPTIETTDELLRSLLIVARDVYPIFLIPRPSYDLFSAPVGIYSHPESERFNRRALIDESLSTLFPNVTLEADTDRKDLYGIHSEIAWSSGQGGGLQLGGVVPSLLTAAYRVHALEQAQGADAYLIAVRNLLEQARCLARGETVQVPHIIGLRNIDLAVEHPVALAFGTLAPSPPGALKLITQGEALDSQVSAVLRMGFPLKALDVQPFPPDSGPADHERWEQLSPTFLRYRREAERRINMSRFALLLASRDTLIGPSIVLDVILLPLSQGFSYSFNPAGLAPVGVATIDEEMSRDAEAWSRKLAADQPKSMDVGMRRLLSAVTTRFDPADGLVDAVICWENMFGTDQETTFRVCGAMAKILEPSRGDKRAELNRELKRIYRVRSKIVHGSHDEPPARQVVTDRDTALRYALSAVRKLYERPQLLPLESATRSTCLLLDLPTHPNV